MQQQAADTGAVIVAKAAPPVLVVGASMFGMPVSSLAQWLTVIYLALMIAHKCWHMVKEYRTGRNYPVKEDELP